jgi:hypothetical protein
MEPNAGRDSPACARTCTRWRPESGQNLASDNATLRSTVPRRHVPPSLLPVLTIHLGHWHGANFGQGCCVDERLGTAREATGLPPLRVTSCMPVAAMEECPSSPLLRRADNSKRDQHTRLDAPRLAFSLAYLRQLNPG